MNVKRLTSDKELSNVIENDESYVLLKHSLTCPISDQAKKEFEKFSSSNDVTSYIIHIQENRELSNQVAEHFQVKHQSPQVFYVQDGDVQFHASHFDITAKKLEKQIM
ncbi:bacillithiol system redox-active protein YtxJ [Halalkalibacillus sediminis]|uniref:Bacillithiol system redox-active protein YtxJ n=1 Tax=Halalkalibacillus sediminis TaxID=2018042 RepID=A0A2I0QYA9_9BACI|nr:bacillithiol system redox-active protein YtxJ [Halalkalibacillus sediminis]PKR79317.1 bacillithiol system redox-active protein YtxJ [Halalkalibacillus sediminis]